MQNLLGLLDKHGIYKTRFKFRVLALFTTILVLSFLFKSNAEYANVIFIILFGLFISDTYTQVFEGFIEDNNQTLMSHLEYLQTLSDRYQRRLLEDKKGIQLSKESIENIIQSKRLDSMYMDANLIQFLYDFSDMSQYNPRQFYLILKGVNQILKIKRQQEDYYKANGAYMKNTTSNLQAAMKLKTNVLNNMHDMIYTIPKVEELKEYLYKSTIQLDELLGKILDDLYDAYSEKVKLDGPDVATVYIPRPEYQFPKAVANIDAYKYII
jgi:hypothetical protein